MPEVRTAKDCTYVGAGRSCVDGLLGCPDLEVYEVEPTDAVNYLSDTVNPLPPDW